MTSLRLKVLGQWREVGSGCSACQTLLKGPAVWSFSVMARRVISVKWPALKVDCWVQEDGSGGNIWGLSEDCMLECFTEKWKKSVILYIRSVECGFL